MSALTKDFMNAMKIANNTNTIFYVINMIPRLQIAALMDALKMISKENNENK
jgi:hypothetical protein